MKIFRVIKNHNYTTINNTIFKNKDVSCKAKGFFATVMSLPDNWDFSVNGMASILSEGKSSIYSAIDELEKAGFLKKVREKNEKGNITGISYTFFETPINSDFHPHRDFPDVDNPKVDNRPQLNTNIINNLNNKTNIDFDALLVFFNKVTSKKIKVVNAKAKTQLNARIKDGYTKQDIAKAIINCFNDKYHKENPHFLTLEFISRPDKFEKYFNMECKFGFSDEEVKKRKREELLKSMGI